MEEWAEKERGQKKLSERMMRLGGVFVAYVFFYGLLFYGITVLSQKGYQFFYEVFGPTAVQEAPGEERVFQVQEKDTIKSVSKRLEEEGLIVDWKSFSMRMKLVLSNKQELQPGVYQLRTDMNYKEIINQLTVSEGITP